MTWHDFDNASALERDVLRRALPAMPSSGETRRATYDPSTSTQISVGFAASLGFTPEGCVDRLGLRPLLVSTAWRVLDLLLEEALAQAGVTHDHRGGYTIALKQQQALRCS